MPLTYQTAFELQHFNALKVSVKHTAASISSLKAELGFMPSDEEICQITGAPSGATVTYKKVPEWRSWQVGEDAPPPGLYFNIEHPTLIEGRAVVGLCNYGYARGMGVYLKDINLYKSAPVGMATTMLKRIARFCLENDIPRINLMAAGGRDWPDRTDGTRWGGYYAWPRMGFDMNLLKADLLLLAGFPNHPKHLRTCRNVQDVLKRNGGLEWWKVCGSGYFMEFDCSSDATVSVTTLVSYLTEKGL
jgi:hypothetical protein